MATLTDAETKEHLSRTPLWALANEGGSVARSFELADFAKAMVFVNRVAQLAEAANHHPDIDIRWNTVSLTLSTHSEGGLTEKDFALAAQIDDGFEQLA